ncbi:acidPPc domain-containing protein [Chloropicon primus]|uniref:Phosphatidic acid phosphatase type 2/haloperoxidase domain-containing protein n=1 Tax=Chloropicon primus TaxID=1764295 RepID=A0A5B8ML78_9CHLO|nr:hypothetical protein A3770_05p35490 [Chloropicon primus]UPR00242.1 acidPPc domain-containing protein [Chloropicon primus]|eukprot:QDZ21031.1 hypothetical protein A3770_05p35490 [Chloropicon primus]
MGRRARTGGGGEDGDGVARIVASRAFAGMCAVAIVVLAIDQGLERSKLLEAYVDVPAYEYFYGRRGAYLGDLGEIVGRDTTSDVVKDFVRETPALGKLLSKVTLGRVLSNLPVVAAAGCICLAGAYHGLCLACNIGARWIHAKGVLRFGIIVLFGYFCGGKGFGSDTVAMEFLKNSFGRQRPTGIEHGERSLSFPSGHTNGASFFCGALATLVVPNVVASSPLVAKIWRGARGTKALLLASWIVLTAVTGLGRVASLKHWCSDCVCGTFTGAFTVSLASTTALALESKLLSRSPGHHLKSS